MALATEFLNTAWSINDLVAGAGLAHHRDDGDGKVVRRFTDARTGQQVYRGWQASEAGLAAIALMRLRGL